MHILWCFITFQKLLTQNKGRHNKNTAGAKHANAEHSMYRGYRGFSLVVFPWNYYVRRANKPIIACPCIVFLCYQTLKRSAYFVINFFSLVHHSHKMTTNPHSQNTHNQPLFHANKRVTITQSRLRHYQDHIIQLTPMHYNEGGTSLKDMLELSSRGNDGRFCATKKAHKQKQCIETNKKICMKEMTMSHM